MTTSARPSCPVRSAVCCSGGTGPGRSPRKLHLDCAFSVRRHLSVSPCKRVRSNHKHPAGAAQRTSIAGSCHRPYDFASLRIFRLAHPYACPPTCHSDRVAPPCCQPPGPPLPSLGRCRCRPRLATFLDASSAPGGNLTVVKFTLSFGLSPAKIRYRKPGV